MVRICFNTKFQCTREKIALQFLLPTAVIYTLLRGEIGLEGGFFNNFYEFFSKNRIGYNLFILYEHFVYIFKKIL